MKILILEDELAKLESIKSVIKSIVPLASIDEAGDYQNFFKFVERADYDLIVADLLVPRFENEDPVDITELIIDATRDHSSRNFRTPVLILTGYDAAAESSFRSLNLKDISIVTFISERDEWKETLRGKVLASSPSLTFEFVIVCALPKEVHGFIEAGYDIGDITIIEGIECRPIKIGNNSGVIVTCPRMGLVSAAITSSRAIELFKPKLICMSGICAGVPGKTQIYDVVISEICHQHDCGKWSDAGFEPELYSVQIEHELRLRISKALGEANFLPVIKNEITLSKSEIPDHSEVLEFDIKLAPASSGSAVVASGDMTEQIKEQHRKMTAFEMESFAVYEAARLSTVRPLFFSAKSVVDDGGSNKGDRFHRVACILSAKVVYQLIAQGI